MGRVANVETIVAWRERLRRQGRSGFSVAEFCRRGSVSPASFYAWRKRLKDENKDSPQPLFVPVAMDLVEGPSGVQIELPGGAVVRLSAMASAELVATAIRAALDSVSPEEARPC
jgi:transposase-like protein